jgi:hypothetical protein
MLARLWSVGQRQLYVGRIKAKLAAWSLIGFAFQKFSKPDRHRPRIHVNHVPTLQVADQTAIKIIQVVIKDDGTRGADLRACRVGYRRR